MKNTFIAILLTTVVVIMAPHTGFAKTGLAYPHNFDCSNCHNSQTVLGATGYNNVCVSCHNAPNMGANKSFRVEDAANPYGTITSARSLVVYQTSHNWAGPDVNIAAGALAPTSAYMTNPNIKGALLCARCHNVHGPRSSALNSAPFLRIRNDNDEMCMNCHRLRSTTTHTTGSHPININYSTAKLSGKFNFAPVSTNRSNLKLINGKVQCSTCHGLHYSDSRSGSYQNHSSFANLSTSKGMLLRTDARGKTAESLNICTNCHAGKKAHNGSDQNIQCNDCHSGHVEYDPAAVSTEEKLPNLFILRRYMKVKVAADRYTSVRTFYRYTGANKEFYRGTVPADGALGVCQACHYDKETFKSGHYNDPGNPAQGIKDERKVCADCHDHKGNFGCSSCHGFPPKENARGKNGYAVWSTAVPHNRVPYSTFNEHSTPHATHADATLYKFACIQCHKGNTAHNTGNFQQVFLVTTDNISPVAEYNTGSRNCTNTYCHSNGRVPPTYQSVTWGENKGSIVNEAGRCTKCHSDKTDTTLLSGAHDRHAASTGINYSCQNCHAKTLRDKAPFANNSGLIFPSTSHVNGTRDVSYSFVNTDLQNKVDDTIRSYEGSLTCNTIYCHSNGKGAPSVVVPNWNNLNTGKCGTCHGVLGSSESGVINSVPTYPTYGMISSGAHFTHLSSTYGPRFAGFGVDGSCKKCHSSFVEERTHVNGDFKADQRAGETCYKCHGGWQQGAMSSSLRRGNLIWTGARLACSQCHPTGVSPVYGLYSASRYGNLLAPSQINYSTTGHGKSVYKNNENQKLVCTNCHNDNSAHIRLNVNMSHSSRLKNFSSLVQGYTNYTGQRSRSNTLCNSCHWQGKSAEKKVMFTHVTSVSEAKNGTPTMACSRCHNVHGTSNFGMINNSIVFNALSAPVPIVYQSPYTSVNRIQKNGPFNFIQTEPPFRGICQVCHTKTIHFKRGLVESDPAIRSNPNFNGAFASHTNFDKNTNCLSCHPHNPPPDSPATFAFYPYGQCDVCHGYPPMARSFVRTSVNYSSAKFEDYTGGGGAHTVAGHVPADAKPGQGWSLCNSCHNENEHLSVPAYSQVKVSINQGLKFNSTIQAKYTTTRRANGTSQNATCYNVSCHFQRTPPWVNP